MSQSAGPAKSRYTFGTSSAAGARLADIAGYFNPLAADFIRSFVHQSPDTAIDLGCGPGLTTQMLREASQARKTYGLDTSDEFLKMASRQFTGCRFLRHDVTMAPFPVAADVMYERYVLSHLRNALQVVDTWITQLRPHGLLLIEEVESIETNVEVFRRYLGMSEGIIAAQGGSLYVGAALANADFAAEVVCNLPARLPVTDRQAASWFLPNTQTIWQENAYVRSQLDPTERAAISSELARLSAKTTSRSNITWTLRRVVLRRPA